MSIVDNKRIAKNTIMLYIRMLLIMAVSLYTSRVILKVLGVEDFGIYNLVAGFITLFTFISNALVSSIQRFLNVTIANNKEQLSKVFSTSVNMMIITSVIILTLGETLGLWFVQTQLNIPPGREMAVFWVYQFAMFTFAINLMRIPYNALIIAFEKMEFYAYISIIEVLLRLGVVFSLVYFVYDKLILYSLLYAVLMFFVFLCYALYCRFNGDIGCRYVRVREKSIFKELVHFSSWSLLGQTAVVSAEQADAFLLNKFYTVSANAAMGVSSQLTSAIEYFIVNFQVAFNPQLTKSYISEDKSEHYKLLFRSSKFSFFLQIIITIPVIYNINTVLGLWLGEVPEYTSYFCLFVLCNYMISAVSTPLKTSIYACGNIKSYEIIRSALFIFGIFLCYVFLKQDFLPYIVAVVGVVIQFLLFLLRLFSAHKHCKVSYLGFIKDVLFPCAIVLCLSLILPYYYRCSDLHLGRLIIVAGVDVLYIGLMIALFGLNREESRFLTSYLKKLLFKHE